jgi:hypothetical protein
MRDHSNTGFLDSEDFIECLWNSRLYCDDRSVLRFLDTNRDGTVDLRLYANFLLGSVPPARRLMVERLWSSFRADAQGTANVQEVVNRFQARSKEELEAFLTAWDVREARCGRVELNELLEWYAAFSASVATDAMFGALIESHWAPP